MAIEGKAWKFGSNVDTDVIIPARYLVTTDSSELGRHCMEGVDPSFSESVSVGDVLVAGENFGCGSSREHAPMAIKGVGISCVIAESFARIFFRNAFNMGLAIFEAPGVYEGIETGDEISIDTDTGRIVNRTRQREFSANPIPPFMQSLLEAGGLMAYVMNRQRG